eukprot:TRINITY_DN26252_c0_g1_i2.p4 TRINITY_DN26252_c0_g1~~TRINITY_DN26252_c0_g1_i2.p4  ORF type:complete len:131 (-),score=36.39 TRINITY_DN26252_c0_g1_i2:16-408(-)
MSRGYSSVCNMCFFFFSSRRRHTRCREVSWARRCVQETDLKQLRILMIQKKEQMMPQSRLRKMVMIWSLEVKGIKILQGMAVSYTHLTLPTILLVQISVVAVSLKKKQIMEPAEDRVSNEKIISIRRSDS